MGHPARCHGSKVAQGDRDEMRMGLRNGVSLRPTPSLGLYPGKEDQA